MDAPGLLQRADSGTLPPLLSGQQDGARTHQEALDEQRSYVKEYLALKTRAKALGLFDKQPIYYTRRILLNLAMLAGSIALLLLVEDFRLQILNAALLAFISVQIAFVAHNSGHQQVGFTPRQNELVTLMHMGLLLGTAASWWVDKHNVHHGQPNVQDMDPDIDFPVVVFSEEQARAKRGLARVLVARQAPLFPLMLMFVTINMRVHSIFKLVGKEGRLPRQPWLEALCMLLHFAWYLGLVFSALELWQALVFIAIHHALIGLYLGLVFAANHKGMPVLASDHKIDFARLQVLTARNVRAHALTDFLYGGLNYQIEHHLFPTIPQNKLPETQRLVRRFCAEHDLPYHETSIAQALSEVMRHLHQVSAPLRERSVDNNKGVKIQG